MGDAAMAAIKGKWKKTAAGLLFLVALFSMGGLRHYYTWNRPQSAEISTDRTVAIRVSYGRTVYVTLNEQRLLYGTYIALALAGIAAVAAYLTDRQ